jgi:hypothetical protein
VERTLLLLDVDGVLVHPLGYKDALRALVDHFAAQMGQPPTGPTHDEIAVFEASGLTNEWDSGALCVAALLLTALNARPDLHRASLTDTLAAISAAGLALTRPNFTGLAREVHRRSTDGQLPAPIALALLREQSDPVFFALLDSLLGDVYAITTPTTRIFQTYVLGSAYFAATYGQPAPFESDSYLIAYDRPLLSAAHRDRLLRWGEQPGHGVVVFTARPSLPPADLPDADPAGCSPEAELAAELLDITGRVPLIGQGRVNWLADRNGRTASDYVKPSPVQALAAIGAAVAHTEHPALESAADLFERDRLTGPLAALADGSTRVIVFEDSAGGIRATRRAVDLLRRAGLDVVCEAVGVSPNPDKRAALAEVADHVVDDVNVGIEMVIRD